MKCISVLFLVFFQLSTSILTGKECAVPPVEKSMESFDRALIEKDIQTLRTLLHEDLTLGHSNGWMETKPTLLENLRNGQVLYKSIRTIGAPEIYYQEKNLITSRRTIEVKGVVEGQDFDVQLTVLAVWICESGKWQLLARQSVGLD